MIPSSVLQEKRVNSYLGPQDMIFPASSFKVAKPDVVASFMELLLGNTRTLETLVWLSNWAVALLDQVLMSCHKSHLHFLTNIRRKIPKISGPGRFKWKLIKIQSTNHNSD
ncbi:hypothetical protein YC2023_011101 [Brassica napus]